MKLLLKGDHAHTARGQRIAHCNEKKKQKEPCPTAKEIDGDTETKMQLSEKGRPGPTSAGNANGKKQG